MLGLRGRVNSATIAIMRKEFSKGLLVTASIHNYPDFAYNVLAEHKNSTGKFSLVLGRYEVAGNRV